MTSPRPCPWDRAADIWSCGTAYVLDGAIQLLAAPSALQIRAMNMGEDMMEPEPDEITEEEATAE